MCNSSNIESEEVKEIVLYAKLLEEMYSVVAEYHKLNPDFTYLHQIFCPSWADRLEADLEQNNI